MSNPITQLSEHPTLALSPSRATEGVKEVAQSDNPHRIKRTQPRAVSTINVFDSLGGLPAFTRHDDEVRPAADATPLSIALNWIRLTRAELSDAAYSKLFSIATRSEGWRGLGSRALSSASLSVFLKFWSVVSQEAAEPQFALMPNGHLCAEWFKNDRRHLDLEFADDWMIYFGLFNGNGIWEGKETIENLAITLKATPSKPLLWTSK
jgi:hypothetical protein